MRNLCTLSFSNNHMPDSLKEKMQTEFTGTRLIEIRMNRSMTRNGEDTRSYTAQKNRNPFCLCARTGEKATILAAGYAQHTPDIRFTEGHISRKPCIAEAPNAIINCVCGEQR
jgi:hypothetical protein